MKFPLAFVDLETTGATALSDRITEVGIVEVSEDGVSEWSCLVNPQTRISDFIVHLTGISNEMVADAPRFAEIAEELLSRLQGRLFIAHNARFDYGFLKAEFKRAGIAFRAPVLCTVKLSRRLYPQHARHNLDALIQRHGLDVTQRHRALGDARLIHQFWRKVQVEHPTPVIEAAVQALSARPSLPSHLDAALVDDLPQGHGVYLFYGENDLPLYIGKSLNLKKRVLSHFAADHSAAKEMELAQQVRRIECRTTHGEIGSLLLESRLVKQLRPTHNRRLRASSAYCAWHLQAAPGQALTLALIPAHAILADQLGALYGFFKSERAAKTALREVAEEHGLCHGVLGLEKLAPGKPCFAAQVGLCRGACIGAQSTRSHNGRLLSALAVHKLAAWPYDSAVGVREGPQLHVMDRWRHLGTVQDESELHELLGGAHAGQGIDVDVYKILRRLLPRSQPIRLGRLGLLAASRVVEDAPGLDLDA